MAFIAYSFNHEQLLNAINGTQGCEKIIFTLCNLKVPGTAKFGMHLVAHFCDTNGRPVNSNDNEVGCPYPPGWRDGEKYTVIHSQLELCPKFIISKQELSTSLANNSFRKDGIKQLITQVEGEDPTEAGVSVLKTFINVLSQDADGNTLMLSKKAVSFPQ